MSSLPTTRPAAATREDLMADMPWEHAADARAALHAIVTDPEHGVSALSSPRTMSNLLKDLLPDAPREKNLLVAAAEAGLADTLRDHVSQGMDTSTAIRLAASSFSAKTPMSTEACNWVTGETAVAMGISETNVAPVEASNPRAEDARPPAPEDARSPMPQVADTPAAEARSPAVVSPAGGAGYSPAAGAGYPQAGPV